MRASTVILPALVACGLAAPTELAARQNQNLGQLGAVSTGIHECAVNSGAARTYSRQYLEQMVNTALMMSPTGSWGAPALFPNNERLIFPAAPGTQATLYDFVIRRNIPNPLNAFLGNNMNNNNMNNNMNNMNNNNNNMNNNNPNGNNPNGNNNNNNNNNMNNANGTTNNVSNNNNNNNANGNNIGSNNNNLGNNNNNFGNNNSNNNINVNFNGAGSVRNNLNLVPNTSTDMVVFDGFGRVIGVMTRVVGSTINQYRVESCALLVVD